MQVTINYKRKTDMSLSYILDKMTPTVKNSINTFITEKSIDTVNEIRLKANADICLIADSKNVQTDIFLSRDDIDIILNNLCDGSIYAHIDTIREGYINIGFGIRASVCGQAIMENGALGYISDISSINIRIPQRISYAGNYLFKILKDSNFTSSVLLFSPPGVGKTTVLRDIVYKLSQYKERMLRFSVIDTRCEITPCLNTEIRGDVYLSYPKGLAIELATRGMTPEYIICDEISSADEANAILKSVHSGVKLIATTHASSIDELLSKELLKPILNANVFDYAVGISRKYGTKKYDFSLHKLTQL